MAKYLPGPMATHISGSVGGTTYSHNRYGLYSRRRAIPVTATSSYAVNAKTRLSNRSQAWQGLTAAQRLAWREWAADHPVIDALGQQQLLTGHAAYVALNTRIDAMGGTAITDPPIIAAPPGLTSLVQDADIGAGDTDLTFTATPLAAGDYLWIKSAVIDSAGINYVENKLRFIGVSAAAQASPFSHQSLVEARFGTLIVGQYLHVEVSVFDVSTGLLSQPLKDVTIVTTT